MPVPVPVPGPGPVPVPVPVPVWEGHSLQEPRWPPGQTHPGRGHQVLEVGRRAVLGGEEGHRGQDTLARLHPVCPQPPSLVQAAGGSLGAASLSPLGGELLEDRDCAWHLRHCDSSSPGQSWQRVKLINRCFKGARRKECREKQVTRGDVSWCKEWGMR